MLEVSEHACEYWESEHDTIVIAIMSKLLWYKLGLQIDLY